MLARVLLSPNQSGTYLAAIAALAAYLGRPSRRRRAEAHAWPPTGRSALHAAGADGFISIARHASLRSSRAVSASRACMSRAIDGAPTSVPTAQTAPAALPPTPDTWPAR